MVAAPGVPPGIAPGDVVGLPGVTVLGGENGPVGVVPGVLGVSVPPGVVAGVPFGLLTMFGLVPVCGWLMMFGFGAVDGELGFTMPGAVVCPVPVPKPVPVPVPVPAGVVPLPVPLPIADGALSDDEVFNVDGLIIVTPNGIGTRIGCTVVDGEPGVTVPLGLPGALVGFPGSLLLPLLLPLLGGGEFCASIVPPES